MNLRSLFRRKPEVRIVVLKRDPTSLHISDWRGDQQLANTAAKVLSDSDLRLMLQVLENDHPAFSVLLPTEASIESRAILQARAEGYTMALANLRSLAKFEKPPEELFEEFAPETYENKASH